MIVTWVKGLWVIVGSILSAIGIYSIAELFFDYRLADWAALGLIAFIGLPYYVGKLVESMSAGDPAKESQ